jgi:hypothetical protein
MRILLFLLCLISQKLSWAQCSFTFAQDVCEETDFTTAAIQLWDGDFIVGGGGAGCDGNPNLAHLTRFNCEGKIVWQRTYPENDAFGLPAYIKQIDSNTILVGCGSTLPRLLTVNANNGNVILDIYNYIPHPFKAEFFSGSVMYDNGYAYMFPNNGNPSNCYLYAIKIDVINFNILWMKEIILPNMATTDQLKISQAIDLRTGKIALFGHLINQPKVMMITIDTSANIENVYFPFDSVGPLVTKPAFIYQTNLSFDRNFFLLTLREQFNSNKYIATIDTIGKLLRYVEYSNVFNFIQTRDGNYAICGEQDLIRKLDTNFQTIYSIKSPWQGSMYGLINEATDGGLFVGGAANILPTRGDMTFIKAEPHGGINSVQEVQDITAQIQTTPNPATTQVHITSPVKLESYTINNTSGTQLQSGVLDNDNNIDISQLPQGLYFLQVQLENGQRVVKKLLVNKE